MLEIATAKKAFKNKVIFDIGFNNLKSSKEENVWNTEPLYATNI